MGNYVKDYTFAVIDNGNVPLAGNFDTVSFAPVVLTVATALILAVVISYAIWFFSHSVRVRNACGSDTKTIVSYFFHPLKLTADETAIEYSLLEGTLGTDKKTA